MRAIIALISLVATFYFCGRMFYLKEIAKVPLTADMLWLAVWAILSCLICIGYSDGLRGEKRQRPQMPSIRPQRNLPPVSTTRKSKFDDISQMAPAHTPASDADEILAELEARTGEADRPASLPAWAILLRDPFAKN